MNDLALAATPAKPHRIYVDRSRHLDLQRCPRLRFHGYHNGSAQRGIQPVRKSIHLVLGGAVHAGLEVLLREGQYWLSHTGFHPELSAALTEMFDKPQADGSRSVARDIEQQAVAAALADLAASTAHGVELDEQEKLDMAAAQTAASTTGSGQPAGTAEPMIEITFDDLLPDAPAAQPATPAATPVISGEDFAKASLKSQLAASLALTDANQTSSLDWGTPIYPEQERRAAAAAEQDLLLESIQVTHAEANAQVASGIDDYLKLELAALVEGMVRGYARRRWRPLLEQFEVLEVEREGEWKLADLPDARHVFKNNQCEKCGIYIGDTTDAPCPFPEAELWFMSRHDALLLERTTGYLYLESFKTTGAWDRRRAADAEVDMQGLSEAVDVEKRLGEAWQIAVDVRAETLACSTREEALAGAQPGGFADPQSDRMLRVAALVNIRTFEWLGNLPEPPRILGVRYEYLIKGSRRQDKSDLDSRGFARYVTESPLIRAYKTDGITADDRRWAASYTIWDIVGKKSTLYYKTWRKAPVWNFMTIERWIDMLDRGEVQPDSYDEQGQPLDVLAEQFVVPITVYRNDDDMRDMLEQLEAAEVKVAVDVATVQAAAGDPARFRSELNQRFPQNRKSCSYPGLCAMRPICFGATEIRANPESSELYQARVSNHPQEDETNKSVS